MTGAFIHHGFAGERISGYLFFRNRKFVLFAGPQTGLLGVISYKYGTLSLRSIRDVIYVKYGFAIWGHREV